MLEFLNSSAFPSLPVKKLASNGSTFSHFYNYWRDNLFSLYLGIFQYDGVKDEKIKNFVLELEKILCLNGHGAVLSVDGIPTVFFGQYVGKPTYYFDEFKQYSVYSPIFSRICDTEKIIIAKNDSLKRPFFETIHHYSILLAHLEVTFINVLINQRENGGTFIAAGEPEKQAIIEYRDSLANGRVKPIADPSLMGVKKLDVVPNTTIDISQYWETRVNLINEFYSCIGVKTSRAKKGNMIAEEINANDTLLMFNVDDMCDCRLFALAQINVKFNLNLSVKVNPVLKMNMGSIKGGEQ